MTSTAQLQKPEEKTSNWTQIFPAETANFQQSALFVKKLLAVAVSNITYLRAIFPEAAFGDRCLEDLNLKILRDESSCPGACQVIKWVKGCFDALDKKYLKMMVIGIYTDPDDPETIIESYTFKFSYTENEGMEIYRNNKKISSAHSAAETRKATIRLLRTIVVLTQSLQSLPNDVMMTMKLFYYDEVTPENYEPPGFKAASSDHFSFDEEPMNIKVGDVSTNFHTMKLRIKTDAKQFEEGKEEPVEEEKVAIETEEMAGDLLNGDGESAEKADVNIGSNKCVKKGKGKSNGGEDQKVPGTPLEGDTPMEQEAEKPGEDAVDTTGSQTVQGSQEDNGVRCGCGYNEDDGLMIMCAVCRCWQHGVCYQIVKEEEAPSRHLCHLCGNADSENDKPTDSSLHGLSEVALQATCLWRRALVTCSELKRVLPQNLTKLLGVEMTVAQGLVNRLEKEGFLKAPVKSKRFGKIIHKEKLKEGLRKYLRMSTAFEPKKTSEEELSKNNQDFESEIDQISAQTEALDVSGREKLHKPPKRAQKRVKSLTGAQEYEFDECDSQEMESLDGRKRRRKASIVTRSLRV